MKLTGDVLEASGRLGEAAALTMGEESLSWGRLGETARRAAAPLMR